MSDLNDRTPGGVIAYSEYLADKGYATSAQVDPWRTAIQKVFSLVEGEAWESLDLTTIDLDEYVARFQTLAGAQYKAESVTAYKRRIRNAIDAHEHYLSTGRPPTFRQRATKKAEPKASEGATVSKLEVKDSATAPQVPVTGQPATGMTEFPYPLGDGRMISLRLPSRLKSDDVNRICAFIRTLQDDAPEQRQIPRRVAEEDGLAA